MHNFLIYSGSARQGNFTQHVAKFVNEVANADPDITAEVVSPQSLGIDFSDEGKGARPKGFGDKVAAADGYILVAPEYNHGYPGSLKYMLDLNLKEYIHKPVAIAGVSRGNWGGTRMIENLVPVVRELGMVVTFEDLNVTKVRDEVVEGKFKDPETWGKRTKRMLAELKWMSTVLKQGRDNVPVPKSE